MAMESWHLWVIAGVVLMGLEMLGLSFVALAVGVSCLVGALVAYGGEVLSVQLGATIVAALVLTPLFVRSYRRLSANRPATGLAGEQGSTHRSRLQRREGRIGVVITGDFFPAEAAAGQAPDQLQEGVEVSVEGFSGITAQVRVIESSKEQGKE